LNEDPNQISKRTTPTWEMELLLSGALVFSLLKLPVVVDAIVLHNLPSLPAEFAMILFMTSVYLRSALFALSVAFVLHLMLRAYWVALVGVNSVFPGGPKWDRSKSSPLKLAVQQRNWVALATRIETFDNAASLVFASGVALGVMLLGLSVGIAAMLLFSAVLGRYWVLGVSVDTWFFTIVLLALGPAVLASMVDYFFGRMIPRDSRFARLLQAALNMAEKFPGASHFSAIVQTITLNLPKRTPATFVFLLILIVTLCASAFSSLQSARDIRLRILMPPENSALLSAPRHYRDQRRGVKKLVAVPTVATRELKDDALELFIPLLADRHPQAMRALCPDLVAERIKTMDLAHDQAWLRCAGRLFAVQLDGTLLDATGLLYTVDAQSGLEGLLLRVPNTAFSIGKHVIGVNKIAPKPTDKKELPYQIIVFR
jgi:hypothetical protein